MGPKKEFLDMARALMGNFPSVKVDVYALAYWLQDYSEQSGQEVGK